MGIAEKIQEIRREKNLSQKEFATMINVGYTTLQSYEYGKTSPTVEKIQEIADIFSIPMGYFLEEKSSLVDNIKSSLVKQKSSLVVRESSETESSILVPILNNISASAGNGALNEGIDEVEFKSFTKGVLREAFGITHNFEDVFIIHSFGDSMSPTLPEGCLLVVQKGSPKEGQICVCRIGGETYVKRFVRLPRIRLLSDNTFYEPIVVDESMDFEAIGIVAGYYRSFLPTQKNL